MKHTNIFFLLIALVLQSCVTREIVREIPVRVTVDIPVPVYVTPIPLPEKPEPQQVRWVSVEGNNLVIDIENFQKLQANVINMNEYIKDLEAVIYYYIDRATDPSKLEDTK